MRNPVHLRLLGLSFFCTRFWSDPKSEFFRTLVRPKVRVLWDQKSGSRPTGVSNMPSGLIIMWISVKFLFWPLKKGGVIWKGPWWPVSLSYQKKDRRAWPRPSYTSGMTPTSKKKKKNLKSRCHTQKRMGTATCSHPSFREKIPPKNFFWYDNGSDH